MRGYVVESPKLKPELSLGCFESGVRAIAVQSSQVLRRIAESVERNAPESAGGARNRAEQCYRVNLQKPLENHKEDLIRKAFEAHRVARSDKIQRRRASNIADAVHIFVDLRKLCL